MFDLFWLKPDQIGELCAPGQHNGPLDILQITHTEIRIVETAVTIVTNLTHLDKEWARNILQNMKEGGRTMFTLSPEFLTVSEELKITIPFATITADTY